MVGAPMNTVNAISNSLIADHIMGIVPFLRNVLFPPPAGNSYPASSLQKVSITIMGV